MGKTAKNIGLRCQYAGVFTFQETRGAVMNENDSLAGGDFIPVSILSFFHLR